MLYEVITDYKVSFPNRAHHEAEITAIFSGVPSGPLQVRMSRTSPGRYALHEFAKNVYNVHFFSGAGDVITSYSIHYTKLYEPRPTSSRPGRK